MHLRPKYTALKIINTSYLWMKRSVDCFKHKPHYYLEEEEKPKFKNIKYLLILKLQQQKRWANTEQENIMKDVIRGGNVNINEILINN